MILMIENEKSALKRTEADEFAEDIKNIMAMYTYAQKEESLEEAVWRMKELGFMEETIEEFRKKGEIGYAMEEGSVFELDETDHRQIKELSEKGMLVYAVIRNNTMFGRVTSYVVVTSCIEDWNIERTNIFRNILSAYLYNYNVPDDSEFSNIVIERLPQGILERVR